MGTLTNAISHIKNGGLAQKVSGTDWDNAEMSIQPALQSYARGEMSASDLRKSVQKLAPGHAIEPGGLRGNSSEVGIVSPDGTIKYTSF